MFALLALGQSSQGISYQAVATDSDGLELLNQNISVRFTIVSGTPSGVYEFVEVHNATTDDYGLFNLTIGQGAYDGGNVASFADINWGVTTHYLKVDMDATGGNLFVNMGTQQMMSVPYALYAEIAGNAGGEDGDGDPLNEIQNLSLEGDQLSISEGNTVTLTASTLDSTIVADMIALVDSLGSLVALINFGCTDPTACNFSELAEIDDDSCEGLFGCTDSQASNFNPDATCDDMSCIPYVGMVGYGGIVYAVENGSAYAVNITDEISAGNSFGSVYGAINDLNNSSGSEGYFDWSVPGSGDWSAMCSNLPLINILASQNGGISLDGIYILGNVCYSSGNTNYMCCVSVSDENCGDITGVSNASSTCPSAVIRPIRSFSY